MGRMHRLVSLAVVAALAGTALGMAAPAQALAGVNLSVDMTQDARFTAGQQGTLTVEVSNPGSVASSGDVTVEVQFASHYFTLDSTSGTGWACSSRVHAYSISDCHRSDPVAAGSAAPPISIVLTPLGDAYSPEPGGFASVSAALTNSSDATHGNNSVFVSPIVDGAAAGLSAAFPDALDVAVAGTVPVTVTNTGNRPGVGTVAVRFDADDGEVEGSGSGPGWTCNPKPSLYLISCSHSFAIDPGQSLPVLSLSLQALERGYPEVSLYLRVDDGDAVKDTYAEDASSHPVPVTGVADLSVIDGLTFTSQPATIGTLEPVSVSVTNIGTVATDGVTVTFRRDPAQAYTFASSTTHAWTCATQSAPVVCTYAGTVGAHQRAPVLTVTVRVEPAAYTTAGAPGNPLSVRIDNGDGTDPKAYPAYGNNVDAVRPIVDGAQDLALGTSLPALSDVPVGGILEVPLSVDAASTEAVPGPTTLTSYLAPGVTLVASSGQGWACSTDAEDLTCTHPGAIAPDAPAPLTLSLRYDRSLLRGRVSTSFILQNPHQVSNRNESALASARVRAGLNFAASVGGKSSGRVHPDRHLLFNLGVDNVGSVPGVGVTTVTYTVPRGLRLISAQSAPNFDCALDGTTVTCTRSGHLPLGQRVVAAVVRASIAPGTDGTTISQCVQVSHDGDIDADNDRACADYVVTPES